MLLFLLQPKDWTLYSDKEYEKSGLTYKNPISRGIAVDLH